MKFFAIALLLIPPAFAQMTNLPCVPPAPPPIPYPTALELAEALAEHVGGDPLDLLLEFAEPSRTVEQELAAISAEMRQRRAL